MFRTTLIAVSIVFVFDTDLPSAFRLREKNANVEFPAGISLPLLPELAEKNDDAKADKNSGSLTPEERLALIRFRSGEFAKAIKPPPAGKQGLRMKVGEPINQQILDRAVATYG